jgi:hypothetical protein
MIHCPACYQELADPVDCVHRKRYGQAEAYVKERVLVVSGGSEAEAWFGGCFQPYEGIFESKDLGQIYISSDAYKIYGWDMMTSILIHEFGHHELFRAEGRLKGIVAEHKANEYGYNNSEPQFIPPLYWDHRRFFLRSYERPGELQTGEEWNEAAKEWRRIHMQDIIDADSGKYKSPPVISPL